MLKNRLLKDIRRRKFRNTLSPQFIAKAPHSRVRISGIGDVEQKQHEISPEKSRLKSCLPGTLLYILES